MLLGCVLGQECVFPFTYQGKQHSSCITANHNTNWCATTENYDTDKQWKDCEPYVPLQLLLPHVSLIIIRICVLEWVCVCVCVCVCVHEITEFVKNKSL